MISDRALKRWRIDALKETGVITTKDQDKNCSHLVIVERLNEQSKRILRLTQELTDLRLIAKL